jgi:hypothetical protein
MGMQASCDILEYQKDGMKANPNQTKPEKEMLASSPW